ncbi:4-oxalocrotonate tautomerase DmpI [Sporolactobacillus laevolacticus]|uniref:4-oxalocrotonate tautomerase DmpI n=1 Tax=Sporolactobacillus laevolacticus TaxID=33018 RepID=UPI0025B5E6AB|nr:4-oxalocrotonate tautomerase DmpI [Sporolactobacillus laevolacticus]MDN3955926.1 tautomerase family protein [Sporolactobacillus laevolacticus]
MPVITIEAGKLNKQQKSQLIKEFTNTASKVMNVPEQAFIVLLKENEADNVGVGGQPLSE